MPDERRCGTIRQPQSAHLAEMAKLFKQGQQPHHAAFPDLFGPADNSEAINTFLRGFLPSRNPFRKRSSFAKGWFVDGALRGYLLYRLYQRADVFFGDARWVCFIEDIVIDREARSMGGASGLMGDLMDELASYKGCAVSGTVWRGNDASGALFQKHGFDALSQSFYRMIA